MSNSNNLSRVEANLPPGFRFHPRDEELICDYLMKKIAGFATAFPLMIVVDLNKCEPWDIPETACVGGKYWYFYSQRDRKYATGSRTNRATVSGYWKATGKDREVLSGKGGSSSHVVGMRKTLVFYKGRAPKGNKTDWVMHEFRLHHHHHHSIISSSSSTKEEEEQEQDWVVCRVFHKKKLLEEANKGGVCLDDLSCFSSSSSGRPPRLIMDQKQQQQQQHHDDYSSYINFQPQDQAQAQLLQVPVPVPCFSISNAAATTATTTFTGDGGGPIINYYNNMNIIPPHRDDDDYDELMNSFFNTTTLLSHDHIVADLPTVWNYYNNII